MSKLAEALKLTDDIEGSVIYIFNLIHQILNHHLFNFEVYNTFKLDEAVFLPFSFHKILRVRITFQRLLNKFLTERIRQPKAADAAVDS